MKNERQSTPWDSFAAKMSALGIDPLAPFVGEDHPHFEDVQTILAEFGGIAPLPPLPPNWEGPRPVVYDGTLDGVGRWLESEWRQTAAQAIFPGAGQPNLAHLNAVISNAYRAFAHFQVADPPKREARATTIPAAQQRLDDLLAFVRRKMKSGWESPTTDQPSMGKITIANWSDLGIGLDVVLKGKVIIFKFYAFVPCPENGARVKLKDGIVLPLKGKRWTKVLPCFADSDEGTTATKGDLLFVLGYGKKKMLPSFAESDDGNAHKVSNEEAALAAGLKSKAKSPFRALTVTMADLTKKLGKIIATTDNTTVFKSNDTIYQAAFVTRHLFRDPDDGSITFGPAE